MSRTLHDHLLALVVTLPLFALALAATSARADEREPVPFLSVVKESFAPPEPCGAPGVQCATASGSGLVVGLGQVDVLFTGSIDFGQVDPNTGCAPDTSTGYFQARGGDRILVAAEGSFCITGPASATDEGTFRVTGGTGRFAGAAGEGHYRSNIDLGRGSSVDVFLGRITLPEPFPHHH